MIYSLTVKQWETGNVRETYFFNQVGEKYKVSSTKGTDFLVEDKYYFELGGKSKSRKQIKNLENAYVVKDGFEIGNENTIPLWLFGFLY